MRTIHISMTSIDYEWGDFHARSRFARSTIPEEKWGTTRSLSLVHFSASIVDALHSKDAIKSNYNVLVMEV